MKRYNLNTVLEFGMHKGKTLEEVVKYSGVETFNFPDVENKPQLKFKKRKKGEKLKLSSPEEIKQFLNGKSLKTNPDGTQYINWCILNVENFLVANAAIFFLTDFYPHFSLTENAKKVNDEKYLLWREELAELDNERRLEQNDYYDYQDYDISDFEEDRQCGACLESPCMCSDPERTSTTYNGW